MPSLLYAWAMSTALQNTPISQQIWEMKYRLKAADGAPLEASLDDTWRRVATALAGPEAPEARPRGAQAFYQAAIRTAGSTRSSAIGC